MPHYVKCYYCGKTFNRDKEPFTPIEGKKRYAHEACYKRQHEIDEKEKENKEKLEEYIKKLFDYKTLPDVVQKQIKKFISENNYTYSGMLKSLIYFYEVKGGDKEKANGRIGIIPYVYNDAFNYYYQLWEIQQRNEQVKISEYITPTIEVKIKNPERKPMGRKRKIFSFLDEV